ncbi:MAG: hypothetical protein IJC43_03595 [Clostridia bacterium]|nr:hypothetical protein [Clostridia bacterium]
MSEGSGAGRRRRSAAQRDEERMRSILRGATPSAARLLAEAIDNEELTISVRLDCAKDVLNRVYGKQPSGGEEPPSVSLVLSEEVKPFAR